MVSCEDFYYQAESGKQLRIFISFTMLQRAENMAAFILDCDACSGLTAQPANVPPSKRPDQTRPFKLKF